MTNDPIPLTEWLDNQKERAAEHINDDRVGHDETERWKGERQLIDAIQSYLDMGVVSLE